MSSQEKTLATKAPPVAPDKMIHHAGKANSER
jgi:hypothetical protein